MPFYSNLTDNIELDSVEYASLFSLNVFELLVHLSLTCPFSILNFCLIFRTRILHPNLKFILLSQSASICARAFVRVIICALRLHLNNLTWKLTPLLIFLYTYSAYFRNILAHILVIERIWATVAFKNYEWSRGPYFTIGWFIFVNGLTFVTVLGTSETSSTTFINVLVWATLLLLAIVELATIVWLRNHNDRIYCNCIVTASLSERYQLAENIRTAKQLIPVLLIHFFNILLGFSVNSCAFFQVFGPLDSTRTKFKYELMSQLHTSAIALTSFLIELAMIICHPYLKRNLLYFCSKLRQIIDKMCCSAAIAGNRIVPVASITNECKMRTMSLVSIRGEEMLPDKDEADEYFSQLRRNWEKTYQVKYSSS